jgi:signal peptidase II
MTELPAREDLPDNRGIETAIFIFGVIAILLADQWTKTLVRINIPLQVPWLPKGMSGWLPWFRILHIHNSGTIFGLFPGRNLIFLILALVAVVVILRILPSIPPEDWMLRLAVLFQFGGALGNLTDRIRLGYVTDFISILNLPVFNLADLSITIGVAFLVLSIVFDGNDPVPATKTSPEKVET